MGVGRHYPVVPSLNARSRAVAEVVAGAAALLAFVATSNPDPAGDPEPFPDETPPPLMEDELTAAVVLHNGTPTDRVVRLRRLAPAVDLDCAVVLESPGARLSEALLGQTESWTIPAGDNLGLDATQGRACEVIRLEGDGFAPRWLVWEAFVQPAQFYSPDVEPEGEGVVRLLPEGTGVSVDGVPTLVFPTAEPERGEEHCAPVPDGRRLDWGDPLPPSGIVLSATWGPDGCGSVVLSEDGEVPASPWFVCMPETAWPFAVGDAVQVQPRFSSSADAVELSRDAQGVSQSVFLYRGAELPELPGLPEVSLRYAPHDDCGYDVERTCGTVSRAGQVIVPGPSGESELEVGEVFEGVLEGVTTRIEVLTAQSRHALDPECAQGPDVLGPDLGIVMTQENEG